MPSKKFSPKSKPLKNLSDPELAHSHPAGTTVHVAQPSVDKKWGRYHYYFYKRNGHLFDMGNKYYKKSLSLLNKCRKISINTNTNIRTLPDNLRNKLEINSISFLVFTKMGFEYLAAEYIPSIKQIKDFKGEEFSLPAENENLIDKIRFLINALDIKLSIPQSLITVLSRRDVVEHPTPQRLYNGSDTEWKNNHLAWVLSGEIEGLMDEIIPYINIIIETAERYIKDNPVPGTVTALLRGMKAGESFKK